MKAVDFIAYFDGSETEIKLGEKHQEVSEIIRLNKENFLHEGKIFISNYTFRAPFFLEGIMLNHIVFNNCIFIAGLHFQSVTNTRNGSEIRISGCDIGTLEFNNCQFSRYFTIFDNKIDHINIYNHCKFGLVNISENKNIGSLYVSQSNLNELFIVKNESASSINLIEKSNIKNIIIKQNHIEHILTINDIENNQIIIEENHVNKSFSIDGIKSSLRIDLKNNITTNYCSIEINNTNSILFSGGSNSSGLTVKKGDHHTQPCTIKMECNDNTKGLFSFVGLSIKSFQLVGTIRNTEINLDSLYISSLELRGVNNYGQISINDIHPYIDYSKIIFFKSDLGNLTLFNCDLDGFNSILIDSVHLTELKAIQTKWFNPGKLNNEDNLTIRRTILNREIYRQLKLAMTAQADTIQALEFKNLEMAEYMKELKTKPIRNWKECSDVILMFLNRSNSYGINWIKPALLAVLYTAICYLAMSSVFYSNNLEIINPECGKITNFIIYTWSYKTRFFQLLDPTFKVSEVFGASSNLTFSLYAWATLLKIGVAYLIFQTIAAFRKYLK